MNSEARGLGLGTKIFLMTAGLIALAVGAAVVVTAVVADRIAGGEGAKDLAAGRELLGNQMLDRAEGLVERVSLLGSDPTFGAYVLDAIDRGDLGSIVDQLEQRQADLGYRFAAALDYDGVVLASTDPEVEVGEDRSADPLVSEALDQYYGHGLRREGDRLLLEVVVPITPGGDLAGFLLAAYPVEVASVLGKEVAVIFQDGDEARVVATTLGSQQASQLAAALAAGGLVSEVVDGGTVNEEASLDLGDDPWVAHLAPLGAADGEPVALTAVLVSMDRQLAPFRAIQRALLLAGLIAVVLAAALSYGFARRLLSPIRRLAVAATAARQGDYDQEIGIERGDEVGQLAGAFDHLLADLREKRDMEEYVSELSRTLPEAPAEIAGPAAAVRAPERALRALLSVEYRRLSQLGDADAAEVAGGLEKDLRRLRDLATARRGRVETVAGHRVWVSFAGESRCRQALAMAADLLAGFPDAESAPALCLVDGALITGEVTAGNGTLPALIGSTVQQLDSLSREASPGEIVFTRPVYRSLEQMFTAAGVELAERRGLLAPQPLYFVSPQLALRVTKGLPGPSTMIHTLDDRPQAGRLTTSEIRPGTEIGGRFEILSVLGVGGMGVVYKARDRELDDLVALKMLRADRGIGADEIARLKDELRMARRITHPNVLRTHDLGVVEGTPFISMEYVPGVTLRYLLDHTSGRLPYAAGLRLSRQLCHGLAAAHAVGVIHRDIKPENLILEPTGNAKLMDFGIARPARRVKTGPVGDRSVVGTPHYLAPEQLRGEEATARSDIYSAGVVLYEIFTGALPLGGTTITEVVSSALHDEPTPPADHWPEVPPALAQLLLTCLEKDPASRFPHVDGLLERLDRLRG